MKFPLTTASLIDSPLRNGLSVGAYTDVSREQIGLEKFTHIQRKRRF